MQPLIFPVPPAVPIIGEAYALEAVLSTVLLICKCPAQKLIALQGLGAQGQCPACRRVFLLQGVQASVGGPAMASIGVGIPKEIG